MNDLLLDKTKDRHLEHLEYYFKNLDVVFESDEEVTSIYRGHEKAKNDARTMSFKEIVAWEKEELQSPSYLRSPHVWKSNSVVEVIAPIPEVVAPKHAVLTGSPSSTTVDQDAPSPSKVVFVFSEMPLNSILI
ncbi:hypothetical protein Tco_0551351 [Tanacetum coccineum]